MKNERSHIEFCGLPGAGKTTIVNKTFSDDTRYILMDEYMQGVLQNTYFRKLIILFKIFSQYARITQKTVLYLRAAQCDMVKQIKWTKTILYFLVNLSERRKDDRVLVLDQGIVQLMWSAMNLAQEFNELCSERMGELCLEIKQIFRYKVVYVDVSPETASERAGNRKSAVQYDLMEASVRYSAYIVKREYYQFLFECLTDATHSLYALNEKDPPGRLDEIMEDDLTDWIHL